MNFKKDYYQPKILTHFYKEKYFLKEDIKKSNKQLQITDKGLYSISLPEDAEWITNIIKKTVAGNLSDMVISDVTAGMGGNTISFAKKFKSVNAVELNTIHYNVLKNNIDVLGLKNVNIYNYNILKIFNKFNEDIVFIDPPWGGRGYKRIKYFNLRLGRVPIYKVINNYYEKNTKYVVLKAPYNINVTLLFRKVSFDNVATFKTKKMWILIFH